MYTLLRTLPEDDEYAEVDTALEDEAAEASEAPSCGRWCADFSGRGDSVMASWVRAEAAPTPPRTPPPRFIVSLTVKPLMDSTRP